MKSSAPQTTMSISLAPMIADKPPEGAEPQEALYQRAPDEGYGLGYRHFTDSLRRDSKRKGSTLRTGRFYHDGRGDVRFWWQEVAK